MIAVIIRAHSTSTRIYICMYVYLYINPCIIRLNASASITFCMIYVGMVEDCFAILLLDRPNSNYSGSNGRLEKAIFMSVIVILTI